MGRYPPSDSYTQRNLDALFATQPEMADQLQSSFAASQELEVVMSRSGEVSGRIGSITLHSLHDPRLEAQRIIDQSGPQGSCYVLEGFGMGFAAEALLSRFPSTQIVIVEPDVPLFLAAAGCRNLTELFSSNRVSYVLGTGSIDAVGDILQRVDATDIRVVRFRPLYERHRHHFEAVDRAIETFVGRTQVNQNTLVRFGRLWVRNLTRNLTLFLRAKRMSALQGLCPGVPGLLLGAGPSLDAILPHLAALSRKCIIVAVDTSLAACRRAGVEPDFVVVVDPQYWNTRHLDAAEGALTPLISESSTHPRVFRLLKGDLFFCGSLFPLGEYIETQLGEMGKLGAGGSVSTSAWDFLRTLGCNPVYTAGLDLGFPAKQTHFRGSFFENRILSIGFRLKPVEDHSFRYLHDAGLFMVADNSGEPVATDKRMVIYRTWFEGQFRQFPLTETRSLSPHSVRLEGAQYAPLDQILSRKDLAAEVRIRLTDAQGKGGSEGGPPAEMSPGALRIAVGALIEDLEQIERLARRGIELVTIAGEARTDEGSLGGLFSALDEIDRELGAHRSKDIAGFLMQEQARSLASQAAEEITSELVVENSRRIYAGLLDSCRFHRYCLLNGIERLGSVQSAS